MKTTPVTPVKFFCGLILSDMGLLDRARKALADLCGPIDHEFGPVPFDFTDYYTDEMGEGLQRVFVSFGPLADPAGLRDIKVRTNAIEQGFAAEAGGVTKRRVNLDPGYVAPAKLVLATTKDFSHRVYLGDGIFAEVTLNFQKHGCQYHQWTYPDFKSGRYESFFLGLREELLRQTGK